MKVTPVLISGLITLFLVMVTSSQSPQSTVLTKSGPIQGSLVNIDGLTVYQFLGIPYAQPPLGELRFKKPRSVHPWSETLNANRMPPACIQYAEYPFPWFDFEHGKSEDCLYLNIWVPEDKGDRRTKKAVMFWIHGGGFVYGSIRKPEYNGRALAAIGNVIVVTINYRLGAFGFFTSNTEEAPVNVALHDMLKALKWVNKNIDEFGGDPNQVTIFGESAGSIAVGIFCVSPLTKGLFSRVIMESGSPTYTLSDVNTTSLLLSDRLSKAFGCSNLTTTIFTSPNEVVNCMRKKDALEIAKTLNSFNPNTGITYFPVYGNEFIPDNPREAIKMANFHDASVLIGNTRDEGSVLLTMSAPQQFGFFGKKLPKLDTSILEDLLKKFLEDSLQSIPNTDLLTKTILGTLVKDDYRKNLKIIYDIMGDFTVVCPDVYFAESYSRYGKKVFFYFFTHRPSTTPWADWMGVPHYTEVQFVFGLPLQTNYYTHEEVALSRLMMALWSNFAKYGNPTPSESKDNKATSSGLTLSSLNNTKVPQSSPDKWPTYSREAPVYLILNKDTENGKQYGLGPEIVNCNLFRSIFGFP